MSDRVRARLALTARRQAGRPGHAPQVSGDPGGTIYLQDGPGGRRRAVIILSAVEPAADYFRDATALAAITEAIAHNGVIVVFGAATTSMSGCRSCPPARLSGRS